MLSVYFHGISLQDAAWLEPELARHGVQRTFDTSTASILLVGTADVDPASLAGLAVPALQKIVMLSSAEVYGEGDFHCGDCGPMLAPERTAQHFEARRWELLCPVCDEMLMPEPVPESHVAQQLSPEGQRIFQLEQVLARLQEQWGCMLVILRLFSVYGPQAETSLVGAIAQAFLQGESPQIDEDGCQLRDLTYYPDVAQAIIKSIQADNLPRQMVFNIGSGTRMMAQEIAGWLQELLGREAIDYTLTQTHRPGEVRHRFGDISRARHLLGYQPEFNVLEGLKAFSAAVC